MQISKLDAARRQLDTAIRLYFEESDEVSVHTLAGAAHVLLTDLHTARNTKTLLHRYIRPEKIWEFEKAVRKPQNFFKHAADDPTIVTDFANGRIV